MPGLVKMLCYYQCDKSRHGFTVHFGDTHSQFQFLCVQSRNKLVDRSKVILANSS